MLLPENRCTQYSKPKRHRTAKIKCLTPCSILRLLRFVLLWLLLNRLNPELDDKCSDYHLWTDMVVRPSNTIKSILLFRMVGDVERLSTQSAFRTRKALSFIVIYYLLSLIIISCIQITVYVDHLPKKDNDLLWVFVCVRCCLSLCVRVCVILGCDWYSFEL